MKLVPLAVRLPLTEIAEEYNVTWSPLVKVTVPASLSVDTTVDRHVRTDRHRSTGGHCEATGELIIRSWWCWCPAG